MKKQVLTITSLLLFAASSFAQFTATEVWGLNKEVDPMPHNSFALLNIKMGVTYNSTGVPTSGTTTTQPGFPFKFRITSTTSGNSTVCISSSQEGSDPWEDDERATFMSNGSIDTAIIREQGNNGAFQFSQKIVYQAGVNANQYAYQDYGWINNGSWTLYNKVFYYLSNGRQDSVVQYSFKSITDSTRNGVKIYYYSQGLDSSISFRPNLVTGIIESNSKIIVDEKENGKTKVFTIYNKDNGTWKASATISYSNGPASSVKENDYDASVSIYPNPATTSLNINLGEVKKADLIISDIHGKVVSTESTQQQTSQLNIESLNSGIYFLTIKTEQGNSTQKFIKQ